MNIHLRFCFVFLQSSLMNYIALSVPVFFVLILAELLWSLHKGLKLYRINDSIANISCGIGQQLTDIVFKSILFFAYVYCYEHFRLFTIPQTWYSWILLFLGVDFCYYWFHRLSHEVNAIWATHVVHHQSEEYNLSVALRQSWFQGFFSNLFYIPLAFLGFAPLWTVTVIAFNTLYQFWIHTEAIRNLGPLEYVLNTPSHHRVHHGSNPQYIDKNHGGSLIIWDRLFGTFAPEKEKVRYGITIPLNSWNPLWANLHYWVDLIRISSKQSNVWEKIKTFTKSPSKTDFGARVTEPNIKFEVKLNRQESVYSLVQFLLLLALAAQLLFSAPQSKLSQLVFMIIWCFVSIISLGTFLQKSKSSYFTEFMRLAALSWCFSFSYSPSDLALFTVGILSVLSIVHLHLINRVERIRT